MSERMKLEGSMVAIVTPFSGEDVDYDTLGNLIEFQIDGHARHCALRNNGRKPNAQP